MSRIEDIFAWQLKAVDIPTPEREMQFASKRRWRFDFAWPEWMVALEIEGGTHVQGRHVRPSGFEKDCIKYNHAAIDGWTVLRVTSKMVEDGRALETVETAFEAINAQQ